ncbi:acyl-CoA dehydrogenase family protein [Streptomyces sp. NPDC048392]|uniref:acyl-CoA dehydrogenase family protein n=1 Tax=Streptomyces sp. NPDC048392 TaxID=3365543 RepID=UPI0037186C16
MAAFALSEPDAGSDAAALSLRADPTSTPNPEPGSAAGVVRPVVARVTGADPSGPAASPTAVRPTAVRPTAVRPTGERDGAVRPTAERDGARDAGREAVEPGGRRDAARSGAGPSPSTPGDPSSTGARGGSAAARSGVAAAGSEAATTASPAARAASDSLAAERDGPSGWRLTGEKCWISNAPEADFYTVFARTTPGAGARGVTAFLVPADRPGLTGAPLDMLSPHPIGALAFDAVPVTADDVLGAPDRGFRVAMDTLNLFRPSVGAFAVGMAQAAVDATLAHTTARDAFGGKLRDLQAVSHQVAEMALRTEAARLTVYAAAAAYDAGAPDVPMRAAMAKLLATETAQYVVDRAVQLHGARALRRGHLLEHLYREVRAPRVYEGASEVQRGIIAKELYRTRDARTEEAGT